LDPVTVELFLINSSHDARHSTLNLTACRIQRAPQPSETLSQQPEKVTYDLQSACLSLLYPIELEGLGGHIPPVDELKPKLDMDILQANNYESSFQTPWQDPKVPRNLAHTV
jgi:hypothetical protein